MRSILVALMSSGLFATPAAAQSFVGDWVATAIVGDVTVSEALTVKKTADGYSIEAKTITEVPPGSPTAGPGIDIMLDGNNFWYKRTASTAQADIEIIYSGVVDGDTFTGEADLGGFKVPYNGQRTAPAN
jgi:hypothetical protein